MLPKEAIKEYQKLHHKHFRKELSYEDASRLANELVDFLWSLLPKRTDEAVYEKRNRPNKKR